MMEGVEMTNKANIEQLIDVMKRYESGEIGFLDVPEHPQQIIEALQELQVLRATNAIIAGECGEQYNRVAEVLRFYANTSRYSDSWKVGDKEHVMEDRGEIAGKALSRAILELKK